MAARPWIVPDELWELIAPLLPAHPRRLRYPGRKRLPERPALCGILFVLHTGSAWRHLPPELGCGSGITCWRRLDEWQWAGVGDELHALLLARLRAAGEIDFSRAGADSSHVQAKKGASRRGRARLTTARPAPLDVDVRHVRVAIARGHAAGLGLVDARQVLLAELDLHGRHVLLQVRATLGARDGHDVVALVQHPSQSKLSGRHALLGGERLEALHELAVAAEVVALETWVTGAEIALVAHVVGRAEAAREEAAPDRGVGHEADAELAHGREQALLRVARPERVLGLQRRDGVHRVSTADRLWRGLGQADVADLARLHELGHRTHGLLDRDLLVHTVLVVQVDVLHAEALERGVAGRVHVRRPAVDAHPAAVLAAHVPELRRQHDRVAPPRDGAPDEALVGEGTVDVRGVDQGHAQLEGAMDGRHRLVLVGRAVELRHAHAAETHGRHLQPLAAESARLQDVALQCSAWSPARSAPASTFLRYARPLFGAIVPPFLDHVARLLPGSYAAEGEAGHRRPERQSHSSSSTSTWRAARRTVRPGHGRPSGRTHGTGELRQMPAPAGIGPALQVSSVEPTMALRYE